MTPLAPGRSYTCGLSVDLPGCAWRNFVHDTADLVTVFLGRLAVTIENNDLKAAHGDGGFTLAGATHSAQNGTRAPTRWLYPDRR